jgi:hypothetical protein
LRPRQRGPGAQETARCSPDPLPFDRQNVEDFQLVAARG